MASFEKREVYTTGQAARICSISQQSLIRCFDTGLVKGFKVPGSRFRRIPHKELVKFMKQNGIPLPQHWAEDRPIFLIRTPADFKTPIPEPDKQIANRVREYRSLFEVGMNILEFSPCAIVLDIRGEDPISFLESLQEQNDSNVLVYIFVPRGEETNPLIPCISQRGGRIAPEAKQFWEQILADTRVA